MRSVLITGTSTGIGEACALRFAERGWRVYAGVRKVDDGDRLRERAPGDVRPLLLDVSNRDQIHDAIAEIDNEIGREGLQGLVNNAGIGTGGPLEYVSEADWRKVFDVNLFGVVALSNAATPLLRSGKGRIVHIGSIGGRLATPGLGPYSASKHAIEALAETQRHELRRSNPPIRVALIEPGEIATAIWDKADTTAHDAEAAIDDAGRARYQWLLDQARGFIDEGRTKGVPASRVADAVEHALTSSRPKARYLVGSDAKFYGHVLTRLPDRARDTLLTLGSRRWERRGRKLRRG